jgi:hypothetical protein
MKSYLLPQFMTLYLTLPEPIRRQARQSYALFEENPLRPSLRFRKVHPNLPIHSARVGLHYRVIGIVKGDDITCFWIGSHAEYDGLLKPL